MTERIIARTSIGVAIPIILIVATLMLLVAGWLVAIVSGWYGFGISVRQGMIIALVFRVLTGGGISVNRSN